MKLMRLSKKRKMLDSIDPLVEICSCNQTKFCEIKKAIEIGAKTLDEIAKFTDAGTTCKYCISKEFDFSENKKYYLKEILENCKHGKRN